MPGASSLLSTARGQLGVSEDPPRSNRTVYGSWYGMQAAWCGMFVSWCAHESGNEDVIPRFAYTPAGAQWFQQRGRFDRRPSVGAVVFYDVSGQGRISHTGIVESVYRDGSWDAIEGNTNAAGSRTGGMVRRNHRTTVGTDRGGFGHPAYPADRPPAATAADRPTLRTGAAGEPVRALQGALSAWLRPRGLPVVSVDGQFGPATRTAVVRFQRDHGLDPDGVVGPLTWSALKATERGTEPSPR